MFTEDAKHPLTSSPFYEEHSKIYIHFVPKLFLMHINSNKYKYTKYNFKWQNY